MQADVYGCPVETIASQEASALGAAMIAACGAGLYTSLKDAVCGMTHIKHRYEPNMDNAGRFVPRDVPIHPPRIDSSAFG